MYEIKSDGDVFRIYNTKTKKMLKPVYKKRETALRNVEKKNCVSDVNDKYVKEKPKKKEKKEKPKKAKEFEILKANTYKTAVIEDVKPKPKPKPKPKKKEKKEKPKQEPRKYKMSKDVAGIVSNFADPSSTSKKKWKEIIDLYGDATNEFQYFYTFQDLIDLGENDFKRKDIPIVTKTINAADPKLEDPPASIINKVSKIILKNKTDTKKIIKDVVDSISSQYFDTHPDERYENMDDIATKEYDAYGLFTLYRNEDDRGFTKRVEKYRRFAYSINALKERAKENRDKFMEALVDYFKTKADSIRAKATIQNI